MVISRLSCAVGKVEFIELLTLDKHLPVGELKVKTSSSLEMGLVGSANQEDIKLSNGQAVRVVNGFHPSYTAKFCPNESCFRRLFTMELCKAFCELNTAWKEDKWMDILRWKCRERTRLSIDG